MLQFFLKMFLYIALLLYFCTFFVMSIPIDTISWSDYIEMHPNIDINSNSYMNFKINLNSIISYNKKYNIKLGVTKYLHLSFEEFSSRFSDSSDFFPHFIKEYSTSLHSQSYKILDKKISNGNYFSWVEKGIINPPLDQGTKPISWVITTKQALDSFYLYAYGEVVDIDMTNLINCVSKNNNYNGGIPYWALKYGMKNPFLLNCNNNKSKQCISTTDNQSNDVIIVQKLNNIIGSNDIYNSPFIIDLQFDFFEVQHYIGGILDPICSNSQYKSSYSALVVGYGKENEKLYWIVQGTFGDQWGEDGYFKILITSECIKFSYYAEF